MVADRGHGNRLRLRQIASLYIEGTLKDQGKRSQRRREATTQLVDWTAGFGASVFQRFTLVFSAQGKKRFNHVRLPCQSPAPSSRATWRTPQPAAKTFDPPPGDFPNAKTPWATTHCPRAGTAPASRWCWGACSWASSMVRNEAAVSDIPEGQRSTSSPLSKAACAGYFGLWYDCGLD